MLDNAQGNEGDEAKTEEEVVVLSDEQKEMCLQRGFAVYEAMNLQGVPPNEATFTAVARLAVAKEDGDLASIWLSRWPQRSSLLGKQTLFLFVWWPRIVF